MMRNRVVTALDERGRYPSAVLVVALSGLFATTFPVTVLTLALPSMAEDFGTSEATLAWVVTLPMIASALALPVLVLCVGTFMNWRYTQRMPLVLSWVGAFAVQGVVRCLLYGLPLSVGLAPVTGVAFVLFTFYMITDPGATPGRWKGQVVFGAATAFVYAALMMTHVGFALFYSLLVVSAARGLLLHLEAARPSPPKGGEGLQPFGY